MPYWIDKGGFSIPGGYKRLIECSGCGFQPDPIREDEHPSQCPNCGGNMHSTNPTREREPIPSPANVYW